MKTTLQQEILLMTGTSFARREWTKKEGGNNTGDASEQLEEACWNGLIYELLPGICNTNEEEHKLFLWHIRRGASFLQMELSEQPAYIETADSIDPYLFLFSLHLN